MNLKLYAKVKDLCKDTGLSEKYLKAITEKMGGSIEDDSTDEAAIETTANLIAGIATDSQAEATRWANKNKGKKTKNEDEDQEDDDSDDSEDDDSDDNKPPKKKKTPETPESKRLKAVEKELADLKAEKSKGERAKAIQSAMVKHNIPEKFRARFAKSIADDEDIEEAVSTLKQDFITEGLMTDDAEGKKAASEKQVDEAADNLLDSITVK